jgi:hypothetical protein
MPDLQMHLSLAKQGQMYFTIYLQSIILKFNLRFNIFKCYLQREPILSVVIVAGDVETSILLD